MGPIEFHFQFRGPLAAVLFAEATKRGKAPEQLFADVIEIVFGPENLVTAILDDEVDVR